MDIIIILGLVVIAILLVYALTRQTATIPDKHTKPKSTAVGKQRKAYLETSGHNDTATARAAHKEIAEIKPETREDSVMQQMMLSNLERYNLHLPRIAAARERAIVREIVEHPEELRPHADFIADRILQPAQAQVIRAAVRHIPNTAPVYHLDTQNVHDAAVNDSVRAMIGRLREVITQPATPTQIQAFLTQYGYSSPQQQARVSKVLDSIMINVEPMTQFAAGHSLKEADILSLVYTRASGNKELEASLVESLADAHENGGVVCTTGRINRVVSSLSHLDDEIGEPVMTKEMVRNEAFMKAGQIMQDAVAAKPAEFRAKYDAAVEDVEVTAFSNEIKQKIAETLREDYKHIRDIDKVVADACAGVA